MSCQIVKCKRGPRGCTGPRGERGIRGPTGQTGPTGYSSETTEVKSYTFNFNSNTFLSTIATFVYDVNVNAGLEISFFAVTFIPSNDTTGDLTITLTDITNSITVANETTNVNTPGIQYFSTTNILYTPPTTSILRISVTPEGGLNPFIYSTEVGLSSQ